MTGESGAPPPAPTPEAALHERPLPDLRASVRTAIPGLIVFVALISALGWLARAPLMELSSGFVARTGIVGVYVGATLLDLVPGVGAQPVLFLGWVGGIGFWPTVLAGGAGGVTSGGLGWLLGRVARRNRPFMDWLFRSGLAGLLLRHRTRAVFLGAILPFPYALCTVAAGAVGVTFGQTVAGATGRLVKAAVNLGLIAGGWSLGG